MIRYLVLGILVSVGVAGCYTPPPPTTKVTVTCHRNWYGARVCTRSESTY
jgi:hypothetical protein